MNIDYILQNHGIGTGKKSKDIVPPPPCTAFTAVGGNSQVVLTWVNPVDTDFVGVKILRKEGSYPTSSTDGIVVYSGANTSYTDTTVTNGITYYYHAFTFDYDNNFNTTASGQEATATPQAYVIYGVKIDTTNSNPETAVTYINNSIGFTKAIGNNGVFSYGSWADKFPFNLIKPCVLKADGTVNYYLNPNNYAQKADGVTASNINNVGDGIGAMVEFPKIYWKIETIGTDIYIRYSDVQIDSSYKCLAHMRGITEKNKCYIGAYLGGSGSTKIYSFSGLSPVVSKNISEFRTLCQANGTGFDQLGYFQLLMLQILYVVMFKNLDSQTALGRGYVDGTTGTYATTGGTNTKGMCYGETTGKLQMKCFGVEDLWGNINSFIDGIFINASKGILIGNQSFNDTGSGYTNYGAFGVSDLNGYISSIQGTTEKGLFPKNTLGSATTYYCDQSLVTSSCLMMYGGHNLSGNPAGMFNMYVGVGSSYSNGSTGTRLMYL